MGPRANREQRRWLRLHPSPVPCRQARVRAVGRAVGPVRRRPPRARPHRAHAHRGAPLQGRHRRGPVGLHAGAGALSTRACSVGVGGRDRAAGACAVVGVHACPPASCSQAQLRASFLLPPRSGSPSASSPTCAPTAARRRAGAWSTRASTWWTRGPWPPAGALPLCSWAVSCWCFMLVFHAGVCGLFHAGVSLASTWRMAWTLATRRCVLPLAVLRSKMLCVFQREGSCWAVERVP